MAKQYHESYNQYLHIGYQCEWLQNPASVHGWKVVRLSGGILPYIFDGKVTIRTPYLTPELLISKGWKLVGRGKHENFGPDVDIYEKEYDDHIEAEKEGGWMADGFRYKWYLSITAFDTMGTYQGSEVKIAEKKSGGFMGKLENRVIFVGKLRDVNELERVGDALGIKDYSDFVRTEREEIPYLMPEDVDPKAQSLVDKMRPLSDNFNSKEVVVEDKYDIKDRGTVWIMDVKANNLPDTFEGQRGMLGHLIREKGTDEVYEIYGVNLPAVKDNGERKCEILEALVTFKSRLK